MSDNLPTTKPSGFAAIQQISNPIILPKEMVEKLNFNPYYTPVIRLLQGSSEIVNKGENDQAKAGVFMVGQETFLPSPIIVVPVAQRTRAIFWENGKVGKNVFDVNDPEYLEAVNHRGKEKQGGIEMLFWLPEHDIAVRYLFSNTALKNAAGFRNGVIQLLTSFRAKGKGWYFVPQAKPHPEVEKVPGSQRSALALKLAMDCHQPDWEIFTPTIKRFNDCDPREDMSRGSESESEEEEAPPKRKTRKKPR